MSVITTIGKRLLDYIIRHRVPIAELNAAGVCVQTLEAALHQCCLLQLLQL